MRPGEGCIVTCDGAYGDPCYAVRKVGLGPSIRAAVRLDAVTEGDEDASYLKERGAMLVEEGEHRRAEACLRARRGAPRPSSRPWTRTTTRRSRNSRMSSRGVC